MHHPLVPVFSLLIASTLWGLSWIPLKGLNELGFDGIFLVLSGQLLLTLLFIPLGFKLDIFKQNARALVAIGLIGGSAIFCFTYAMIYGDVVRVMVLFYLLPVWGVLGGKLFLGEEIDLVRWCGVGTALVGAFFILGGKKIFDTPPSYIDAIAFMSGLLFAGNNLLFRGVEAVPLNTKLFSLFAGCTVVCSICLVVSGEPLPVDASTQDFLWLAVYAFTWLLIANLLSQWAVTQMEAGRSSILIICELFAAVISAIWVGGKVMSGGEVLGCALVVTAALLEALRSPASEKETE